MARVQEELPRRAAKNNDQNKLEKTTKGQCSAAIEKNNSPVQPSRAGAGLFPPLGTTDVPTFTCYNHAFGSSGQHLWQPQGYCRILPKCNGTKNNRPAVAPTLAKFAGYSVNNGDHGGEDIYVNEQLRSGRFGAVSRGSVLARQTKVHHAAYYTQIVKFIDTATPALSAPVILRPR